MSSSSKVVGLTGGIGCGKTTVLLEFEKLGVPCFVADAWGNKLYYLPSFVQLLVRHFGEGILNDSGEVNRKAVAAIVFNKKEELQWLNAQVHPLVDSMFSQWLYSQSAPYVIYESAILYETQLEKKFDKVIAVYLEENERIRRIAYRDHASREEIEARMANQMSAEEKMMRADYVILNYEGNPRTRQVQYFDHLLRQQFQD